MQDHALSALERNDWTRSFADFLQDGHLGVTVFFVISGFLITTLLLKEEAKTKTISLKKFYVRRTLRIFPAYYFLLLVYFILQLSGQIHINGISWLTAVTYTKYFNWTDDWYTSHAWSLSIEEHFYLLWPLVFLCGNRIRKIFAFGLVLIVPLIRTSQYFHPVSWINELSIFTRIDAIAIGCLFALYKDWLIGKLKMHWRRTFLISVGILVFLVLRPVYPPEIDIDFLFIPFDVTNGTIAAIVIGFIMMYSVFGPRRSWFRFLNLRVLNYTGILSYSIYLWQQLCISGSHHWFGRYPWNLLSIFVLAMLSYHLIEKPFLRMKEKFSAVGNS
jgi:peptidoglycan/LPS O-acetylase OafA/YrhL